MRKKRTPLRGSPIGTVITGDREHTDRFINPFRYGEFTDFQHEETKCYCGLTFTEHTPDELSYMHEHKRCKRVARSA